MDTTVATALMSALLGPPQTKVAGVFKPGKGKTKEETKSRQIGHLAGTGVGLAGAVGTGLYSRKYWSRVADRFGKEYGLTRNAKGGWDAATEAIAARAQKAAPKFQRKAALKLLAVLGGGTALGFAAPPVGEWLASRKYKNGKES
jgi:hypothetical protein